MVHFILFMKIPSDLQPIEVHTNCSCVFLCLKKLLSIHPRDLRTPEYPQFPHKNDHSVALIENCFTNIFILPEVFLLIV